MPQASVTGAIVAGGGTQASPGQQQARQVAILGCSPGGVVNTLYQPGNQPAAQLLLDTGPLLEEAALLLGAPLITGGNKPPPFLVPLNQTTVGAVSGAAGLMVANPANADVGTINVTVGPHRPIKFLCTTSGAVGTFKGKFSLDGGLTYGPITQSADTASSGTWIYRVPGTNCVLTFAAANYVATKYVLIGVDGTVTNGPAWVGVVTQASSPIDTYELLVTVQKGGALGAVTVAISLCNNPSIIAGVFLVPAGGVVVLTDGRGNGTGLVLTFASTFTTSDSYTSLALPPAPASGDVTAAITAMLASPSRPTVCNLHIQALPSSVASAIALAQAVDTALASAFAAGLDWQAFIECPVVNDVVMSGGVPILDTADTDSVIRTARAGVTCNRVDLFASTGGIVSPITGCKTRRPFGWAVAKRYVGTDPANSLGRVADGTLDFEIGALGRDEKLAAIQLGDVQINVPTTIDGYTGQVFLNITSGGFALKALTTSALYLDGEALRIINVISAAVRVMLLATLGDRPPVNADGTIAESARKDYSVRLDAVVKRACGLLAGGAFGNVAQASTAGGSILSTSQLGTAPRRLDAQVDFQGLGMVSAASYTISVKGA